jgi:predicted acetyltransferase
MKLQRLLLLAPKPSLQKAEDSKGMTMHDLGDGYTLHHSPVHLSADYQDRSSPILEHDDASKYVHSWAIKHGENTVGMVNVGAHKGHGMKNSKMRVSGSLISGDHQGKGLGRKAYAKLAEHYGGLESDIIRSDAATKAWASIPGVQKKVDENSGDNYRLTGNRKAPPVKFLKSLLKKSQVDSNVVQIGPEVYRLFTSNTEGENGPSQSKPSLVDALKKIKGLLNYKDQLPGGVGDKLKPTDFPAKDMAAGAKEESEHTSNPAIAAEIAIDHLAQYAHYYEDENASKRR